MKNGSFNKVNFTISRTNQYGIYQITATYKGRDIITSTTDSEAYDFIDDDSNRTKQNDALRHCYNKIVAAYNSRY